MNTTWQDIFGYLGSATISIYIFPTIYKAYKNNEIKISKYTLVLQTLACIFFIIYSIYPLILPILLCNSILFTGCVILWLLFLRNFNNNINNIENGNVNDIENANVNDIENTNVNDIENTNVNDIENTNVNDIENVDKV
jgi:hypothetical protein